jgi:LPS export ABC transporter protein LptC
MATQEVRNAQVRRSEYGKLQLELDAPIIQKYEKPKAKTLYKSNHGQRVQLRLYGDDHNVRSIIEASYAISFDDLDIMEAHDSVVVIDFSNGDTIYLEDLIWNSNEDRIYSDHPVRAKNGKRITEGDGFVSDQRMENIQIIHQRGIIEFEE